MGAKYLTRATDFAKRIIERAVNEGDTVIDCTLGKGNDTLLLAQLVGDKGKVIAFDIQQQAIDISSKMLSEKGVIHRVSLIKDSHENIDKYGIQQASCIMFNLGYLPTGNHNIITKASSTIKSMEKGLNLLKTNGIMTIITYTGHEGGWEEEQQVLKYAESLDWSVYSANLSSFLNLPNNPPKLLIVEKKK